MVEAAGYSEVLAIFSNITKNKFRGKQITNTP